MYCICILLLFLSFHFYCRLHNLNDADKHLNCYVSIYVRIVYFFVQGFLSPLWRMLRVINVLDRQTVHAMCEIRHGRWQRGGIELLFRLMGAFCLINICLNLSGEIPKVTKGFYCFFFSLGRIKIGNRIDIKDKKINKKNGEPLTLAHHLVYL